MFILKQLAILMNYRTGQFNHCRTRNDICTACVYIIMIRFLLKVSAYTVHAKKEINELLSLAIYYCNWSLAFPTMLSSCVYCMDCSKHKQNQICDIFKTNRSPEFTWLSTRKFIITTKTCITGNDFINRFC